MKMMNGFTMIDEHKGEDKRAVNDFDIKPCPFCGGHPRLEKASKTIVKGEPAKGTYVRCLYCGARGRRFLLSENREENHLAHISAIYSWNERC